MYISDIEYRATQFNQIIRQHWVNHSILFKSQSAVIHAVEGKDTETIKAIKDYLIEKAVIQVKLTKFQLIYRLPLSVDFPQAQKENLTVRQCQEHNHLITVFPVLGEAYRLKKLIDDFWTMDNVNNAAAFLFFW